MSRIYLIADTHFGHNGISEKFRTEFKDDESHHSTIHHNIMAVSGKRNHLWLLGDICFKEQYFRNLWEYSLYYESVHVCLGNHDHKRLPEFCIQHGIHVHGLVKKWGFWLSHAPIHEQELYRGKSIHGHVHRNTVEDNRYFNVSCENIGYSPITLQEVRGKMEL